MLLGKTMSGIQTSGESIISEMERCMLFIFWIVSNPRSWCFWVPKQYMVSSVPINSIPSCLLLWRVWCSSKHTLSFLTGNLLTTVSKMLWESIQQSRSDRLIGRVMTGQFLLTVTAASEWWISRSRATDKRDLQKEEGVEGDPVVIIELLQETSIVGEIIYILMQLTDWPWFLFIYQLHRKGRVKRGTLLLKVYRILWGSWANYLAVF